MPALAVRCFRPFVSGLIALSMVLGMLPLGATPAQAALRKSDLKTLEQIQDEALRYDRAVLAIGRIATMTLATPADLQAAMTVIDRHGPALGFTTSKLVVMAINDKAFATGLAKRLTSERGAQALARELIADPKAALKIEGAPALQDRMLKYLAANAARMRASAEALHAAAARQSDKVGKFDPSGIVGAGILVLGPTILGALVAACIVFPLAGLVVLGAVGAAVAAFTTVLLAEAVVGLVVLVTRAIGNVATEEGRDAVEACQAEADRKLGDCKAAAADLPDLFRIPVQAACEAEWLMRAGACYLAA